MQRFHASEEVRMRNDFFDFIGLIATKLDDQVRWFFARIKWLLIFWLTQLSLNSLQNTNGSGDEELLMDENSGANGLVVEFLINLREHKRVG